jgi:AcrR family transcriptional regulator
VSRIEADTREHLLTVAERLFLDAGYENVSVRAVCATAGVNPAAVHYHFGSKVGLVSALLEARLGPLWEDALTEAAGEGPAGISDAVRIVVEPLVELAGDPAGRLYLHLLSRLLLARVELSWTRRWFAVAPWVALLRRHLPELSERDAEARWMLAFELIFTQFGDPLAGDRRLSARRVQTLQAFVAAGLSAPVESR